MYQYRAVVGANGNGNTANLITVAGFLSALSLMSIRMCVRVGVCVCHPPYKVSPPLAYIQWERDVLLGAQQFCLTCVGQGSSFCCAAWIKGEHRTAPIRVTFDPSPGRPCLA